MIRSANPREINEAFEHMRQALGRPMTWEEIQSLDAALAEKKERGADINTVVKP
jgi:hypothetical protein